MKLTSILAIYALFWMLCLFIVLPIGVRTSEEEGQRTNLGNADSAPHNHNLWKKAWWTTLLSAALFGVFYANYVFGWIETADLVALGPQMNDMHAPK